MKKALLTGITGQDGSYLAEILLDKGYEVHGIIRRSSSFNTGRIDHLYNNREIKDKKLFLHYGDLVDTSSLNRLLDKIEPDEIYNLGAQSHVKVSFEVPDYTAQVDALGTLRFLDSLRETGLAKQTKFYQASTSELYGKVQEVPQNENTPFYPRSPYGVAKLYGYWIVKNYREAYNLFACNGILFNHESSRRGATFVTRKITMAAARIVLGLQNKLTLGNLDAQRDWGYAPEYCEGMWRILQYEKAEDFVLATGVTNTVRKFVELTFSNLGVEIEWRGEKENEIGIVKIVNSDKLKSILANSGQLSETEHWTLNTDKLNAERWKLNADQLLATYSLLLNSVVVSIDPNYYRPTEVELLIGDPSNAKEKLGWEAKTDLEKLVRIMIEYDLKSVFKEVGNIENKLTVQY